MSDDNEDEFKAGLNGALQGATLGFSDEIGGGMQALMELIKSGDMSDAAAVYKQAVKENRMEEARLKSESPYAYGGGEIAGGMLPGMLTGGAGGASALGSIVKTGALTGAANAYGKGEGNDLGTLGDVAMGAGAGALGAAAGHYGGKALSAAKEYGGEMLGKLANKVRLPGAAPKPPAGLVPRPVPLGADLPDTFPSLPKTGDMSRPHVGMTLGDASTPERMSPEAIRAKADELLEELLRKNPPKPDVKPVLPPSNGSKTNW